MTLQVLIPTYNKNKQQLIEMLERIHLSSDALIALQNNKNEEFFFDYKEYKIHVISTDTKGISINRNILLKHIDHDIGIFIDDDCLLLDNYVQIIIGCFKKYNNAKAILFNGIRETRGGLISKKNTKIVKKFKDVSYAGCPGLALRQEVKKFDIEFFEKIGFPNYIYNGEDSLFLCDLIRNKIMLIREQQPVFEVIDDVTNSSYYKGMDEQYIVSYGAVNRLVRPHFYWIIRYYRAHVVKKHSSYKYKEIIKMMKKGENLSKTLR